MKDKHTVFLDTNLLIYAHTNVDPPKGARVPAIIQAGQAGNTVVTRHGSKTVACDPAGVGKGMRSIYKGSTFTRSKRHVPLTQAPAGTCSTIINPFI